MSSRPVWALALVFAALGLASCGDEKSDEERIQEVVSETSDLFTSPDLEDCDLFVNVGHYPNDDYSRKELREMAESDAKECRAAIEDGEGVFFENSADPFYQAASEILGSLPGDPYDDAEIEIRGDRAFAHVDDPQRVYEGKSDPVELVQVDDGDWRLFIAID